MTQTLELNKMGLFTLSEDERNETNGGVFPWLATLVITLVASAIDNFGDIREGLSDGFNGKPRH